MSNDDLLSIGAKAEPISTANSMSTSDLQFQRAVPATVSGSSCQICRTALTGEYFRARGQVVCPACAEKVRMSAKSPSLGSMPGAILFGIGAAIAGCALYSIVTIVTGYQLALVSIVVGVMVGKAIRHGAKGLGGRPQQILAIVLTYLAITTSYVTMGIYQMVSHPKAAVTTPSGTLVTPPEEDGVSSPASKSPARATGSDTAGGSIAFALLWLGALIIAAPFLSLSSGISGILSIVILFFGLKQAWKLTEQSVIQVTGPYKPTSAT
jgi:hypothetical protein